MASWLAGEAQKFVDQTQAYVTCLINGPATTESESQTETDAAPAYATDKSWWLANPALGVVGSELWVPMQTVPPTTVECAPVAGSPAADVFFVHGTLASPQDGPRGDGNYDCRASLPDATKGYVLSQAACFNAVGRIFAPHYRYAAFVAEDAKRGLDLDGRRDFAFADVDQAFDAFLAASGSRPFFLAGHSQGAVMVKKLLEARFGDESLRRRLVGCYAPGLALFANVAPPLPLATEPGAVGTLACVERRGNYIVSNGHSMPRAGWNCAAEHAAFEHTVVGSLCGGYRPLTALPGLDAAGEGTHLGCFGWGAFFVQVFYTEACAKVAVRDGLLRIVGDKNALAYYATGTGCMHKWDFHLLWLDVRKNAVAQLANYEKETAAA